MAKTSLRDDARRIWDAAVAAAQPGPLVRQAFANPACKALQATAEGKRILVVGGGKAGAAMSEAVELALPDARHLEGLVSVPAESVRPLKGIRLHAARPAGTNQPTAEGVAGARAMLTLAGSAGPDDIGICLLSGGGSALLPAPAAGITLEDKQRVTGLLHACGATINEMNAVRKHLSDIKGGRLAEAFAGKALFSLIISDVIGDPLDVIASGPTAPDPTTFADALAVLDRYQLREQAPSAVVRHLERGVAARIPETPKTLPDKIHNHIIGSNVHALAAAQARAGELGYSVLNLGSCIEGETRHAAVALAGIIRNIRAQGQPVSPPACILSGGETTVTLGAEHGLGGRNQEFVLAALDHLAPDHMSGVVILSGGTDGEDGPTDAAGAIADDGTWARGFLRGARPRAYLDRHDAYPYFQITGDLLLTGLTQTNVMDVRVILIAK